ncbi:uncharacterized protein METZ01_LOCUS112312, partial [marine metagenome]
GTITTGNPEVVGAYVTKTMAKEELIRLTASLEKESSHPLAKALLSYANQNNVDLLKSKKTEVRPGSGIEGVINGKKIKAGTAEFVGYQTKIKKNKTVVYVSYDGEEIGYFQFRDQLRKEAEEIISNLKSRGMTIVLLTGDGEEISRETAQQLGINKVHAELSPKAKLDIISSYQNKNNTVIMIGDGINDAPALSQADVGIAMGTGTDIALEAGDMVLTGKGMEGLPKAFALSQIVFSKIRQNIFWAFIYNIVAVPLAVIGLLHPVVAEAAMALSSINVVLNSGRLSRLSLK